MFVNALQQASNKLNLLAPWSLAIFQVNELQTRELEALPHTIYTLPEQNYKYLILTKIQNV